MSDETIDKFMGVNENVLLKTQVNLDVVYEDSNIIIVNKPVGMLSQKAEKNDVSLNEYIIEYLLVKRRLQMKVLEHSDRQCVTDSTEIPAGLFLQDVH